MTYLLYGISRQICIKGGGGGGQGQKVMEDDLYRHTYWLVEKEIQENERSLG